MSQLKLTDVAKINMGQSPSSETYNSEKNGLPFYQGNVDFGEKYPTVRIWCDKPTKIAEPGDILMSVRAPIGALNYANEKCCIGRGLAAITPDPDMTSSEFIYWFLRARHSELNRIGTGSTFKAINRKTLESIEFPKYNKNEQYYIAEILSKIDKTIGEKKAQLEKLDNLIKARFVEMFGESNCETKKLSEITDIITKGTTPTTAGFEFTNDGVNFFKIESITEDHTINLNKVAHVSDKCHATLKRSQLRAGDVLFSIAGAIGRTAIIGQDDLPGNTNQALAIIRLSDNSGISQKYLISALDSPEIFKQYHAKKRGVAQINLSLQDVGNIEIPIPNLDDQKAFESFTKQVDKSKFVLRKSIKSLMNLWYNINQYVCERTYGEA